MAGPRKWTEEIIQRRLAEGRGSGDGDEYSPWIKVEEFSSKGTQTRVAPGKLKRTVHTMSYLELYMFVLLEFNPAFLGYQEQFPMSRSLTMGCARTLKIRHPTYRETGVPVVMTIDSIAIMRGRDGDLTRVAWDAKPSTELAKGRVAEKLRLHLSYCNYLGLEHRIFTENSAHPNIARNLLWARGASETIGEVLQVPNLFTFHQARMIDELRIRKLNCTVQSYCSRYDKDMGLPMGTALRLFRYLIWTHAIKVDLKALEIPKLSLPAPTGNIRVLQTGGRV